jgi:hypothetical protein
MNSNTAAQWLHAHTYRALVWLAAALPKRVVRWASGASGRRYRKT